MLHIYNVYGLRVATNTPLPCLKPLANNDIPADINITAGEIPGEIKNLCSSSGTLYYREPGENNATPHIEINQYEDGEYFRWSYSTGIEFIIDKAGTSVWCEWKYPGNLENALLSLVGPVIGFMLRLRGIICLHASGMIVDKNAFAICGTSGAGKSSLAAAFAGTGLPILTDDIMPLTFRDGLLMAGPGYPRISLYPDSYKFIEGIPDELPCLVKDWDKCYFDLASQADLFLHSEMPLNAIYILDWKDNKPEHQIQPLTPSRAVSLLAANTYRNELLDNKMREKEFIFLSQVVDKIPVRQLSPVNNIQLIKQLVNTLLDDYSQHAV